MNNDYRPCVGLLILNPTGQIFAGLRADQTTDYWQMPQGGIDPGETPHQAALRELYEETGIAYDLVNILGESDWVRYDLPPSLAEKLWQGKFKGQEQKWFALRFLGKDSDINIRGHIPEFREWQWMNQRQIMDHVIPFKQQTYTKVFQHFIDFIP